MRRGVLAVAGVPSCSCCPHGARRTVRLHPGRMARIWSVTEPSLCASGGCRGPSLQPANASRSTADAAKQGIRPYRASDRSWASGEDICHERRRGKRSWGGWSKDVAVPLQERLSSNTLRVVEVSHVVIREGESCPLTASNKRRRCFAIASLDAFDGPTVVGHAPPDLLQVLQMCVSIEVLGGSLFIWIFSGCDRPYLMRH